MSGEASNPRWTPPNHDAVEALPVGVWWDAVRVPRPAAQGVLKSLGDASGAVIEDPFACVCYWLIEPGSASRWNAAAFHPVAVLQNAKLDLTYLAVPPARRIAGPGLHWRVPLTANRYLTDTPALRAALAPANTGASLREKRA